MFSPSQAQIATHAYALWVRHGRPQGQDLDIWLEAERQLHNEAADLPAVAALMERLYHFLTPELWALPPGPSG